MRSASPTTDSATCDALRALRLRQLRQQQRQLDVPRRGQHRQQVVQLEDEADVARAPRREPPARELVDPVAADGDRSFDRRVETAQQVEQRRLARARRPHQRQEVAFGNIEVDALQDVDPLAAAVIHLVQIRTFTSTLDIVRLRGSA